MKQRFLFFMLILVVISFASCVIIPGIDTNSDLGMLPADSGGVLTAVPLENDEAVFGHYLYLPGGYEKADDAEYPLLVFLHGSGEKGDSSVNPEVLDRVLRNGPPKLIVKGTWDPSYPMIVASPQAPDWWSSKDIQEFIEYLKNTYRINSKRIYLTGLSMGGYGTFAYLTDYGNEGLVAAAVPICGKGNVSKVQLASEIPVWAFHGDADNTVAPEGSIDFVEAYNAQDPPPLVQAKLTIYPGVGHDSWSRTYDGSGMGSESDSYDSFDISVYDWMFQYKKAE